jgi:hypothetical protein
MHQPISSYVFLLSICLSPILVIGAFAFASLYYKEGTAPVGCATYAVILIFGAAAGYVFGLYYGGDWAFHSGQIDCGSGVACALLAISVAGPLGAAFAIVCIAVFLGRK